MLHNNDKTMISKLFESFKVDGFSSSRFEKDTHIPMDRVYKWKQRGKIPKAEDEKAVKAWLDKVDKIPQETTLPNETLLLHQLIKRHEAWISVLVASVAELLSATSGENARVVEKRLEKAAEEIFRLNDGG